MMATRKTIAPMVLPSGKRGPSDRRALPRRSGASMVHSGPGPSKPVRIRRRGVRSGPQGSAPRARSSSSVARIWAATAQDLARAYSPVR